MKRFLLISDLHASNEDPSGSTAPSYVSSYLASAVGQLDPLSDLERVIKDKNLHPDYILCLGDITNRSDTTAFAYVWNRLNQLAKSTNAKLIATVGNHDVDSRYTQNTFDAHEYVKNIRPEIPVAQKERFFEFWAQHFTLISEDRCNILVVNTAAHHGSGQAVSAEMEHGRDLPLKISSRLK